VLAARLSEDPGCQVVLLEAGPDLARLAPTGGAPDLHLFAAGPFDASRDVSPAGAGFGLVTGLVLPFSRGWVRLRSADPADPPRIDVAHLRHPDDMRRMIEATLIARAISRTASLARVQSSTRAGASMASSTCWSPTRPSCRRSLQPTPTCPPS
jgi:choline dehydrogenase